MTSRLWITRISDDGSRTQYDLGNITIGSQRASDLSQAQLYRVMRPLVPEGFIDPTMGHQMLLQKWADHLASVAG
jgi:hypothetical protein